MPEEVRLLDRAQVRRCAARLDPVAVTEEILRQHARGQALLPAEGYLAWHNSQGAHSRSVAMLGALTGPEPAYGIKLINASVSNPSKGMERAGGMSLLFDGETARPYFLAEAGYVSALRTSSYTVASLRHLGPEEFDAVSLIGCGAMARAHLALVHRYFPGVVVAHVHDVVPERAAAFRAWAAAHVPSVAVRVAPDARACAAASRVVITLTVSQEPYAGHDWFGPGTFVAHVSLDDLREEVFTRAERLWVDDLGLIEENPRRILGRLLQEGVVAAADGGVSGSLGQVLTGEVAAARPRDGVVVSNPFGMAILDVGMIDAIRRTAEAEGIGTRFDLLGEAEETA